MEAFYLQKELGGEWYEVTRSYEETSLIEVEKQLEREYPGVYRVIANDGNVRWQGKAPSEESALSNG